MDRDTFETRLSVLIAAYGTKVRSGIDAASCGTRRDWHKSHEANDAYLDAHEAFLTEVFAPPPVAPAPVPIVVGWEEQVRGRTRGRPLFWRRGITVVIVSRGVAYTFRASADPLMIDAEVLANDFNPLDEGHAVRFRGVAYSSSDPGPDDLVKLAIEACRAAALRLSAHGIASSATTRAWPAGMPTFVDIVASGG
ncbi:MAG: hypothetical protein ABJE95_04710 [Byssovorax sp.]